MDFGLCWHGCPLWPQDAKACRIFWWTTGWNTEETTSPGIWRWRRTLQHYNAARLRKWTLKAKILKKYMEQKWHLVAYGCHFILLQTLFGQLTAPLARTMEGKHWLWLFFSHQIWLWRYRRRHGVWNDGGFRDHDHRQVLCEAEVCCGGQNLPSRKSR